MNVQRDLAREIGGIPAMPPGRLTLVANRLRRALHRGHRAAAPPPLQILEALFARFDAPVLRALCDLDIPDRLTEPTRAEELAAATHTDPDRLDRLLRYAAARGFVGRSRRGHYRPNAVLRSLRTDATAPWHSWVRFATAPAIDSAWHHLAAGLAGDVDADSPFALAHGEDFFTHLMGEDPGLGADFDEAMAAGAQFQALGLWAALDWQGVASVCDVGGGNGAALEVLQRLRPELTITLLDLPEVVARARPPTPGAGERRVVGGDFFTEIPPGSDRYLLLSIIHDWDDERAGRILANVASALGPDARAVVVETPLARSVRADFATASDLLMLLLASGRERTDDDYRALFARAALEVSGATVLPTGATAYELTALAGPTRRSDAGRGA